MKKWIKPIACTLILFLSIQCLTGCFDRRELDTIIIVMGVAIDKPEKEEGYEVTIQIANPSESGGGGGKTKKESSGSGSSEYINISEKGKNINYIIREMQNKMSRRVYVAHSQCIVIGEEQAKAGVKDCLDFFARAPEARMTDLLFMAEGKALDVFSVQSELESFPSTMLAKMLRNQELTSQAPVITEFEFMCCMISKTKCPVMPIVRILEDEDQRRMEVDGCAVFKNGAMVGKFDETQTRGMLFIENKIKAGVLSLNIEDASITAELRKAKSSVKPHLYEDGSIKYDVEVDATVGLGDQTGTFNVAEPDHMPKLLTAAEEAIKEEIQNAVDKSKEYNADVFGFGEDIKRKYPDQWKSMEDNWDAIFPNVTVDISVKMKADGSGRITRPLTPEES